MITITTKRRQNPPHIPETEQREEFNPPDVIIAASEEGNLLTISFIYQTRRDALPVWGVLEQCKECLFQCTVLSIDGLHVTS